VRKGRGRESERGTLTAKVLIPLIWRTGSKGYNNGLSAARPPSACQVLAGAPPEATDAP